MKDELDKALCEKYPKIFAQRNAPMSETCMCWGFACGDGWYNIIDQLCNYIQHHIDQNEESIQRATEYKVRREAAQNGDWTLFDKWFEEMYPTRGTEDLKKKEMGALLAEVPAHRAIPEQIRQVEAVQVKEKFGTLRFYYDGGDDFIHGLTTMAEAMSARTCEECGAPGELGGRGWVRTLCAKHAKKKAK